MASYEKQVVKIFMQEFPGMKKEDFIFNWTKRSFEISEVLFKAGRSQMVIAVNNQMKAVKIPD